VNLYQIKTEYQAIIDASYETGEIDYDKFKEIDSALEEKCFAYGCVIKNMQVELNGIEEAIANMRKRQSSLENRIESLKFNVIDALQIAKKESFAYPEFAIKLKDCPPSVVIFDESLISTQFIKTKTQNVINKTMIKEYLTKGLSVQGAELIRNQRVEIK